MKCVSFFKAKYNREFPLGSLLTQIQSIQKSKRQKSLQTPLYEADLVCKILILGKGNLYSFQVLFLE